MKFWLRHAKFIKYDCHFRSTILFLKCIYSLVKSWPWFGQEIYCQLKIISSTFKFFFEIFSGCIIQNNKTEEVIIVRIVIVMCKKYRKLVCMEWNGSRRSRCVTSMMMPRPCPAGSRLLKLFFKLKKIVYNGKMTRSKLKLWNFSNFT